MGKFFTFLLIVFVIITGGAYYYYTQTGYKFGLDQTFLFKGSIGITSTDFIDGDPIPLKFTCDGEDISPTFTLSKIPEGTVSLAIVLDDESIKPQPLTHWLVFNINPKLSSLNSSTIWQDGILGSNDFGNTDYVGPCPPAGTTHRYYFKVYALNITFNTDTVNRQYFDKTISDHILATGSIVGVYSKKP